MNYEKLYAGRIGGERFGKDDTIYKFEKIKIAKREAMRLRPDMELLDFGVGEPDQLSPASIREALKVEVDRPENRGYADNGVAQYKEAAAAHMKTFYGVDLDPATEINHCIGAKPALAMLPLCFINPGDVTIQTVPGYPVLATHTKYLGGEVYDAPLEKENGFFPDLDAIPADVVSRAKLFYVNYPNNPTGAAATPEFFDKLIAFASKNNIIVVQDAPYAALVYGGDRLSILSRPGGKEVALEIHSMSKAYNMTGWRLGFVAGSASLVKAFASVKDNIDSGQFIAIQKASCEAMTDTGFVNSLRDRYQRRLEKMVEALRTAGFDAQMPGGTFYLYVPAPVGAGGMQFKSAEDASQYLIRQFSVSTVPWDNVGAFLRFSATFESRGEEDDSRVLDELKSRLKAASLKFSKEES
ncbi:MAG: LL-diaminopimelate aminotransferase [Verrucomicrobia bacterium]|nr:LL-diaminopimelate aminotransferase [Verrucomicrobiota bacterium]